MKEYPKIKMSSKSRFRIMAVVKKAFNEMVAEHECYGYPPETWAEAEREFWDTLQEMESKVIHNLESIIETNKM